MNNLPWCDWKILDKSNRIFLIIIFIIFHPNLWKVNIWQVNSSFFLKPVSYPRTPPGSAWVETPASGGWCSHPRARRSPRDSCSLGSCTRESRSWSAASVPLGCHCAADTRAVQSSGARFQMRSARAPACRSWVLSRTRWGWTCNFLPAWQLPVGPSPHGGSRTSAASEKCPGVYLRPTIKVNIFIS